MVEKLCFCQSKAVRLQVKKQGPTYGRWFYKCSSGKCSYFKWEEKRIIAPEIAKQQRVKRQRENELDGSGVIAAIRDRTTSVQFSLRSTTEIGILLGPNSHALVTMIQEWSHARWNNELHEWLIPATLPHYKLAYETIMKCSSPQLRIQCQALSSIVIQLLKDDQHPCASFESPPSPPASPPQNTQEYDQLLDDDMDPDFLEQCVLIANAEERLHSYVKPLSIWDNMMEYQRQGVHDALLKQGRVLLADEMGLGKSIQALAIAIAYPEHWPILIICPSSLLMTWSDQIQQWLPFTNQDIRLTLKGSSLFGHIPAPLSTGDFAGLQQTRPGPRFYIISYEMATKNIYHLTQANYNIAICDESHQLKNPKTNRTRELTPLLKKAKVVVMLSGTPALSRPIELFPQLHILNQTLFPNMHQFGVQYCEAHQTRYGWNYQGGSNLSELHFILEKSVMIRRLKDEVQLALPTKTRHIVHLNVAPEQLIQVNRLKKELASIMKNPLHPHYEFRRHTKTLELYVATSQAKIPAILQYLDEWLLSTDEKVIVFAYHLHVVDALACYLAKHQIKFVRMDGNTKQTERHRLCQEFQRSGDIQVALLTITAMNVGMNFQAASKVIFAEIYWNPSHLLQAEDRVHRIGQMNSVQIKYLLAMQTADFMMWSMLMKKLKVVGDVLDPNKPGSSKMDGVDEPSVFL